MTSQEFFFQGWVMKTENKNNNYKPFGVQMRDVNNQIMYFSTFDAKTGQMLEQPNAQSVQWAVQYTVKPWVGTDKVERIDNRINSISMVPNTASQSVVPVDPPSPTQIQTSPSVPTNLGEVPIGIIGQPSDTDRRIARAVAFKEVENKNNISENELWRLTNLYESILLGTYQGEDLSLGEMIQEVDPDPFG